MVKTKNILTALLVLLLLYLAVFNPVTTVARADEAVTDFDKTSILEDLTAMTVDNEPFNIYNYPFDSGEPMQLFKFTEYCYSYKTELQGYYGLYLYIYNPSGIDVNTSSIANTVKMATSYSEGKPDDYAELELQFCSKTDGEYNNLFYKFKVKDPSSILNCVYSADPTKSRRYDVASFKLLNKDKQTADAYEIGFYYTFTGFAKGFGTSSTISTLDCFSNTIQTLKLDNIRHTNYRPDGWNDVGINHQDDLTSVYFSVPTKFIDDYGFIKRIKAEWWEYKTADMVVLKDKAIHDTLESYVGYRVSGDDTVVPYGLGQITTLNFGLTELGWTYNYGSTANSKALLKTEWQNPEEYRRLDRLTHLHYGNVDKLEDLRISKEDVLEEIYKYSKSAEKGYLPIKNGNISADLFTNSVDSGRDMGHNVKVFDSGNPDDWYDIKKRDTSNGWTKYWQTIPNIEPIVFIDKDILNGSNKEIADRYYINEKEVGIFKKYYEDKKKINETVVLLRIANTDYWSAPLAAWPTKTSGGLMQKVGYACSETVFLDFNVIWLDFVMEGKSTIIPVVASPIDITSETTPPIELDETWGLLAEIKAFLAAIGDFFKSAWSFLKDWGLIILGGALLLIVLPILAIVFPPVASVLWFLLKAVLRGLWWLLKIIFYVVFSPILLIVWLVKKRKGG